MLSFAAIFDGSITLVGFYFVGYPDDVHKTVNVSEELLTGSNESRKILVAFYVNLVGP